MKKTSLIFASLLGALMMFSTVSVFAQTTLEEFVAKWDNGRQFTLDVVDKMPDDLLNYKPHESAMSFNEQVTHLSGAMVMIAKNFLMGSDPSFDPSVKPTNKEELKALVAASYDYVKITASGLTAAQFAENVEIFGNTASRRQVLALIDDHTTHHRGAAISYIRANGIEPPRFSGM